MGLTSDKRLHSKYTLHFPRTELSLLEPLAVWKPPAPKPPQERLGPRCKGKAGAELRPGRCQWRLPTSCRLLLPGQEVYKPGKSGQGSPQAEQPRARNSARSGLSAELELCHTGGPLGSTPARLAAAGDWAASSSPEEAPFHLSCALGFQAEPYLASCRSWLRGYFP